MLQFRARVDQGAVAMKGCSAFSKTPASLEPQHQIVQYHIQETRWVLPLCRGAVSVVYNPSDFATESWIARLFLSPETSMNDSKYVKHHRKNLELGFYQYSIVMHDIGPCYWSKVMSSFFIKITKLDWLGNSSQLNPLENFWEIVKGKIAENKPSRVEI